MHKVSKGKVAFYGVVGLLATVQAWDILTWLF